MSAALGTGSTIDLSNDGGADPYVAIGKITTGNLSITVAMADSTSNDDGGDMTYLPADRTAKLDVTVRYDPASATQTRLLAAALAKTLLFFRVRPTVGAGLPQWIFSGFIESAPINSQHATTIESTYTIQCTGGIAKGPQ